MTKKKALAKSSETEPEEKEKAPKTTALTKVRQYLAKKAETFLVPSGDVADDEAIVRHMSAEDIAASAEQRALAIVRASIQASPAQQLAYGALLCIFDVDKIVIVRDDDESVWPFAPDGSNRWRGAIRRRDDVIEESWFLTDEQRIVWEKVG